MHDAHPQSSEQDSTPSGVFSIGTVEQRFPSYLREQLATRLRMCAVGALAGGALAATLIPQAWPWVTVLGIAALVPLALPNRWLAPTSTFISIGIGLLLVGATTLAPASTELAMGVLVALTLGLLLPLPPAERTFQVVGHFAVIVMLAEHPTPLAIASTFAMLCVGWWFSSVQMRQLRTLWEDRATLEHVSGRLARERDRRGAAVRARERELLEQQDRMVQQEQWATLGRVAVGVGHEIKNPLQAAMSDVETARRTGDLSALDDALEAMERIATLLRDLSLLRGSTTGNVEIVDLEAMLRAVVRGARMGLPNLRVTVDVAEDVPVHADQARLVQVFANLLTNAWHASEAHGAAMVAVHAVALSDRILVFVDDDGDGIPPELHERAFEAFVTTKRAGKGSGLGLPISRALLRAMEGDLRIEGGSSLGGARLVVQLKRAPSDAARALIRTPRWSDTGSRPPRPRRVTPAPEIRRLRGGSRPERTLSSGHLLIIDDDPIVRRSVARLLGQRWTVQAVAGTAEARQILRAETVDVVLCDLNLVQEDALDAIAVLRATRPDLVQRTVFMSGEPTSSRLVALAQANPERLMGKPFDLNEGHELLLSAQAGKLPWLELPDDVESVDPIAVLEPAWTLDSPTEEIVQMRDFRPGSTPS